MVMTSRNGNPLLGFIGRSLRKFGASRDFTVSVVLHAVLVAIFGTTAIFQAVQEAPEFVGDGTKFVTDSEPMPAPPAEDRQLSGTTFPVTKMPGGTTPTLGIHTPGPSVLDLRPTPFRGGELPLLQSGPELPPGLEIPERLPANITKDIGEFADWEKQGPGMGNRQREFEFTAFLGRYEGGDWNSTVRLEGDRVIGGSLPNLLYIISKWSRGSITTNEDRIRVISLDSDKIFAVKPPFIFLTGTRDFRLTDAEVENLRRYVRTGGCIWGDASIPGLRSRFDIAFRREMQRILPDVDMTLEPLPENHPIFTDGYFPEIRSVPPGINYYDQPVFAKHLYGQIAILYTANDYGDMWQIGITEDGAVDLRRNERSQYIAVNPRLWDYRNTYIGNIAPMSASRPGGAPSTDNLTDAYKFGTNIVYHLLTRWDAVRRGSAPAL